MKKLVLLSVLLIFITACVPSPETIAGVTKEDIISGKVVEQAFEKECPEPSVSDSCKQTLADATQKEVTDVAYHDFEKYRDSSEAPQSSARVIDGGALEAGVGEKFKVGIGK